MWIQLAKYRTQGSTCVFVKTDAIWVHTWTPSSTFCIYLTKRLHGKTLKHVKLDNGWTTGDSCVSRWHRPRSANMRTYVRISLWILIVANFPFSWCFQGGHCCTTRFTEKQQLTERHALNYNLHVYLILHLFSHCSLVKKRHNRLNCVTFTIHICLIHGCRIITFSRIQASSWRSVATGNDRLIHINYQLPVLPHRKLKFALSQ